MGKLKLELQDDGSPLLVAKDPSTGNQIPIPLESGIDMGNSAINNLASVDGGGSPISIDDEVDLGTNGLSLRVKPSRVAIPSMRTAAT